MEQFNKAAPSVAGIEYSSLFKLGSGRRHLSILHSKDLASSFKFPNNHVYSNGAYLLTRGDRAAK